MTSLKLSPIPSFGPKFLWNLHFPWLYCHINISKSWKTTTSSSAQRCVFYFQCLTLYFDLFCSLSITVVDRVVVIKPSKVTITMLLWIKALFNLWWCVKWKCALVFTLTWSCCSSTLQPLGVAVVWMFVRSIHRPLIWFVTTFEDNFRHCSAARNSGDIKVN